EQARPPYRRVVRNGAFAGERCAGALATEECYRGEVHHAHAYGFARVVDGADQPFLVPRPPRIEDLARAAGEEEGSLLPAEFQGKRHLPTAGGLRPPADQRRLCALLRRHEERPWRPAPIDARHRVEYLDARRRKGSESPPGLEILAGVRGELRAIFDNHAHFLHLRDRLPIHVGRSEVEVAL